MPLRSGEVMLTVTQHSHCKYWLNAFAHILEVELGLTGLTSTSRNVRRTFHVPCVAPVQCSSPDRSSSYPIVELVIAEMACVSRNIRSAVSAAYGIPVQRSISERDASYPFIKSGRISEQIFV